jgi:hypothetical protein
MTLKDWFPEGFCDAPLHTDESDWLSEGVSRASLSMHESDWLIV